MANYAILRAAIQNVIKANGNNEITGSLLQQSLVSMINALGENYQYVGIASLTPTATNPGTPDANVFYIANQPGTYNNFGGLVVNDGEIAILKYNGAWIKDAPNFASYENVRELSHDLPLIEKALPAKDLFIDIRKGTFVNNGQAKIDENSATIICVTYIPITADPTIIVRENGQQVSIGKRFYDVNKTYLGTTYSSTAKYVRFLAFSSLDVQVWINNIQYDTTNKFLQCASVEQIEALADLLAVFQENFNYVESALTPNPDFYQVIKGQLDAYGDVVTSDVNCVCITYLPITSDPEIIVLDSSQNVLSIGKRFYDENKTYLGTSYSSAAKYIRFFVFNATPDNIITKFNDSYLTFNKYDKCATKKDINGLITNDELFNIGPGKNIYNPQYATFNRRWAYGWREIRAWDSGTTCGSGFIPVEEGKTYTISGNGIYDFSFGAYFAKNAVDEIGQADAGLITFITPVDGIGKYFTVPMGQNIGYIELILNCNSQRTELAGNVMVNLGEVAGDYEPYIEVKKIKDELLPGGGGGGGGEIDEQSLNVALASLKTGINYAETGKIAEFRRHYLAKDKDLVVLNTGTSLTMSGARNGACRLHPDIAYRPPLCTSYNYISALWDKLAWSNQYYRRYDAKKEQGGETPMFTETGSFISTMGISAWDDDGYRDGFTRYADITSGVSVSFNVPAYANQFNFIYRTDLIGCQNCAISIQAGNGRMQVFDEATGNWVEANGYIFSMRESPVTLLPSVSYINPSTGAAASLSNYQVKGNTTYQKRLKMRTVLAYRDVEKSITISGTGNGERFMYWGVEWSLRPYMITLINAARGSHNPLIAINSEMRELNHYQDNEVWNFKPDIFITENPIINAGSSGPERYTTIYWANITENFFFAANGVSLYDRAKTLFGQQYADGLEWVIFNTSPAMVHSFNGTDEKCERDLSGNYLTWLDANELAYLKLKEHQDNLIAVNSSKYWREAALRLYGTVYQSCVSSEPDSYSSFSFDGTHWNELGCKIIAKAVLPIIDFI